MRVVTLEDTSTESQTTRGLWMKQRLVHPIYVALDTLFREIEPKQNTMEATAGMKKEAVVPHIN